MQSLFAELRRRHVYRTVAFYAAAGWLLVQIATQVAPYFDLPNWSVRLIIVSVIAGFPIAVLLSWYYEWSPSGGWRREIEGFDREPAGPHTIHGSLLHHDTPAATPPDDQSIAVLPFADMSAGKDQEYFSDGLAEELLNLLAQLPQLRVISRTSSFSFKGSNVDVATIGRKLHVANVLEGSVRKSGDRLRITAQLIRASDSSHLWSQTYDRETTDVFAMQDEIAGAVVAALKLKLLPNQQLTNTHRTSNSEAHEQYLIGRSVFKRGHYDRFPDALAAYQRAVALDPLYAAAHAGLASAQSAVADFAPTAEQRTTGKSQAMMSAEKAITLAPELADGYIVRAQLRYRLDWDWSGAEADLQKALALDPNNSDALMSQTLVLYILTRWNEALASGRKAIDADPLSMFAWTMYGALLHRVQLLPEARAAFGRALAISPESSIALFLLAMLELDEGHAQAALDLARGAGESYRLAATAMAEYSLGHEHESLQAIEVLKAKFATGFAFQIAQVHAWRGDADAAFEWLDRAYALRDSGLPRLRGDWGFEKVKSDARWTSLMQKLNFSD